MKNNGPGLLVYSMAWPLLTIQTEVRNMEEHDAKQTSATVAIILGMILFIIAMIFAVDSYRRTGHGIVFTTYTRSAEVK
jgi:hypothetical protein